MGPLHIIPTLKHNANNTPALLLSRSTPLNSQGVDDEDVSMLLVQDEMLMDLRSFIDTARVRRGFDVTAPDDDEGNQLIRALTPAQVS